MTDLTTLSLVEICDGLRNSRLSSLEVTSAFLEKMEHLEPFLHAFITPTPDMALEAARQADRRLAGLRRVGEALPTFPPGIPLAIKDVLCLEGVRCTCGSRILETYLPPFSATAVQKLLEAGMVPLGKTNMDEFAMGSSTENSAYGPTRNPWQADHVPGGSSGGSAAAVAARMAPAALGTDTGGSVRQPASFCGLTGLKPTYGRVSRYGLTAFGSSLDTVGIFAHSARDAALVFQVIAGHDAKDATTFNMAVPSYNFTKRGDIPGVRIGIPEEYFIDGIQPEVENGVQQAIEVLQSLGAEVLPVSLPHTQYAVPVYYLVASAEASANLARYDGIRYGPREKADTLPDVYCKTRGRRFGAEVKRRIMLGTYALSAGYYDAYYGQAQKVRMLIQADFQAAFQRVDVIAAPVTPSTAFQLGKHTDDPLAMYLEDVFTLPASLAGIPGIAFPVGFDSQGLPMGMQLMGPAFSESLLMGVCDAFQQATIWHLQIPPAPGWQDECDR